jgi:hypothetical protein
MIFRKSGVNAGIERWFETDSKAIWEAVSEAAVKTLKEQPFFARIRCAEARVIAELLRDGLRFACS